MKSIVGAIIVLLLAWAICELVSALDAGGYLASVITSANINPNFIPVVMFIVASFMAFATGTSWESFGILLPIAGSVAAAIDMNLMIPVMAAVSIRCYLWRSCLTYFRYNPFISNRDQVVI